MPDWRIHGMTTAEHGMGEGVARVSLTDRRRYVIKLERKQADNSPKLCWRRAGEHNSIEGRE
eukprot:15442273-Alexandrium_andersonii.AAC.1